MHVKLVWNLGKYTDGTQLFREGE